MPASKIQDHSEVLRWFAEGRTYAWMVETYQRKYGIKTGETMWSNFRSRHGLDRRIERHVHLIPWSVQERHRYRRHVGLLRREGRRRAGMPVSEENLRELDAWIAGLRRRNLVVAYDPESRQGFTLVPRRPQDNDLIREPDQRTSERSNADRDRTTMPAPVDATA